MTRIYRLEGRITKGIGGFYYVNTPEGVFECRARGSFRKDGLTPLVGDMAKISADCGTMTGTVDEILPRSSILMRPPVANVTRTAIVIAAANPRPNLYLTDKLLAAAELAGTEVLLCINKTDIEGGGQIAAIYKTAGYNVVLISAKTGTGAEELKAQLGNGITVFAGNSGVGKSSILNMIIGRKSFETGVVSKRAERGKHTTRHSELAQLESGGYIIDTPGFGSLDFSRLNAGDCARLFPEFEPYTNGCRFRDCSHTVEKGCAVIEALKNGAISATRHESYVRLLEEIKSGRQV